MTKVTRVYFIRRPQCYYDNLWCQKNFTSTKTALSSRKKRQTTVDQSKNLCLKKLNQHFIWSHLNPTADAVFYYSTQAMYYFKTLLMRDLHINVGHYLIKIWKEHIRLHQNFSACLFSPFMQILVAFGSTISNSVNWHWHWPPVDKKQFEWKQRINDLVFKTRFNFCLFKSARRSQITLEN